MAYINQDKKKNIVAAIKALNLPPEWKMTYAVRHHMSFVCTIRQAPESLVKDCILEGDLLEDVKNGSYFINQYHFDTQFKGKTAKMLKALLDAINHGGENFDKSDAMSDYFHVGYYVDLHVGESSSNPCTYVNVAKPKAAKPKAAKPKAAKPKAAKPTKVEAVAKDAPIDLAAESRYAAAILETHANKYPDPKGAVRSAGMVRDTADALEVALKQIATLEGRIKLAAAAYVRPSRNRT